MTFSSIWLVGMFKIRGKWHHAIVGGMLYTSSGASEESPPAAFIHYIATAERAGPPTGSLFVPSLADHPYGGDREEPTAENPTPAYGGTPVAHLHEYISALEMEQELHLEDFAGGLHDRRIGVLFLSLLQCLLTVPKKRSPGHDEAWIESVAPSETELPPLDNDPTRCRLYLQSSYFRPDYRRWIRMGWKYSTLHQFLDGGDNSKWSMCVNPAEELPTNLQSKVKETISCQRHSTEKLRSTSKSPTFNSYKCNVRYTRLLVMEHWIKAIYPPTVKFGNPGAFAEHLQLFDLWKWHTALPKPCRHQSINFSYDQFHRSAFHILKTKIQKQKTIAIKNNKKLGNLFYPRR
jgi:hypothetical protein